MFVYFILFLFSNLQAQEERVSPLIKWEKEIKNTTVSCNYGQPSKKNRMIFGNLVPYDKVWRTGANEATEYPTPYQSVGSRGVTNLASKLMLALFPR